MPRSRYQVAPRGSLEDLRKELNDVLRKMSEDMDAQRGLDGKPIKFHADLDLSGYRIKNVGQTQDAKDVPNISEVQSKTVAPVAGEIVINYPVTFVKEVHHKAAIFMHERAAGHPYKVPRCDEMWEATGAGDWLFPNGIWINATTYSVQNLISTPYKASEFIPSGEIVNDTIVFEFGWFTTGAGVLEVFFDAGTAGVTGSNGYLFLLSPINGQQIGQIYRVDNGTATTIATFDVAANGATLAAGWRTVAIKWVNTGNMNIRVRGTKVAHAADATYTANAPIGYGYIGTAFPLIRNPKLVDSYRFTET